MTTYTPHATIEKNASTITPGTTYTVWTDWTASDGSKIDRPRTGGISAGRYAERVKAAINAGAAYGPATLKTDVNGRTYVQADFKICGRHLNADLQKLGF